MQTLSARERFRRRVRAHGGSASAARTLGCSRSYVDMIIKGDRRPGMRVAHAIERSFGIPMQDWLDPDTQGVACGAHGGSPVE